MNRRNADVEAEKIEREYFETAMKRSQFLRINESKKANKEYDKLYRLLGKLRHLPDRGEAALKRIASADDLEVQIEAPAVFWRWMNTSQSRFSNKARIATRA
jgi:hypothetical protein